LRHWSRQLDADVATVQAGIGQAGFACQGARTSSNFSGAPVIRSTTDSSVAILPGLIGLKKNVAPGVTAVTS
jgi:hypothetical protein